MYSREHNGAVASSYINAHKFSYLNITNIGSELVQDTIDCGDECVAMPSCFSFNLLALADASGKLSCELLPSDIYRNTEMLFPNQAFHHFSIPVRYNSLFKRFSEYYGQQIAAVQLLGSRHARCSYFDIYHIKFIYFYCGIKI